MRILLRILFWLMILVGALLAIVSPWFAANVKGYEIGRFALYDAGGGWTPVEAPLSQGDAPVFVTVYLTMASEIETSDGRALLDLVARTGDATVLERKLSFSDGPPTKKSPQAREATYRDGAGGIESVTPGAYSFTVTPADGAGLDVVSAELVLHAGGLDLDQRAGPAGYAMILAGLIGLVLSMRRVTGRKPNPNEKPPPDKWGRQ